MGRVNLRAAFMAGLDSPVAAQHVFADRVDELAAFSLARENLDRELEAADVSPVVDRSRGRRNVLSYYGVGGIGKSTLSQELERRFDEEARDEGSSDAVSVRVDLADDGAADVENLVLRLRAGLGQLGSRWHAFDLALSCYWARAHPGEPLGEFLDSSPLVRTAARAVNLGEQVTANAEALLALPVAGLPAMAGRAGLQIYRAVRDRVREGRLLADCDLFSELVEADADREAFSFFPYLLAWDLDRLPRRRGERPSVCVFLDTFESVTGRPDRTAERHIQRCVYLMPNVLFVVAGRNRLDWADQRAGGDLDFTRAARWPNLHFSNHADEPRQHLVGYLSDSDADGYLCAALTEDDRPAIPADVRERIVTGAQGLPLYLDLSVSHYVEQLAQGAQPTVDDFGGSFTAVATRSLRDLSARERDLVRTASLVDRFDGELLRMATTGISDGQIGTFLRRPFLARDDTYELPYTLHLTLRVAVSDADHTLPDGWSDRDRSRAAGPLLEALGDRLGPAQGTDRATVAQALETGLKLAAAQDVFADWLVDAAQLLVEAGEWARVCEWLPAEQPDLPELGGLAAGVEGVVLRRSGEPGQAATLLQRATAGIEADSKLGRFLRLHLAHALRNTGDYRTAAGLYEDLRGSELDNVARYWLCDHDFLNGRFAAAQSELDSWRGRTPAEEGERLRLLGHIARVNARFDDAVTRYDQAVTLARSEGLAAAEAKALTNLAQTTCWTGDPATVADLARRARELLELVPNPVELVKLQTAEAVAAALAGSRDVAASGITAARAAADEVGYPGGHNLADVASILRDSLRGDDQAALPTLEALARRTRTSGGNTYWVPIAASWLRQADTSSYHQAEIDWLDGPEETLRRWAEAAHR